VGFLVDKVALGQVFSKYFGYFYQYSFHQLLHTHHHLSSGTGTVRQLVADAPSGLSRTPPHKTKKKKTTMFYSYPYNNRVTWLQTCIRGVGSNVGRNIHSPDLSFAWFFSAISGDCRGKGDILLIIHPYISIPNNSTSR
jgi:hypothetical protein